MYATPRMILSNMIWSTIAASSRENDFIHVYLSVMKSSIYNVTVTTFIHQKNIIELCLPYYKKFKPIR